MASEGILSVNILSASNIVAAGKAECFIRLSGTFNKQQFKTKVIKKNANPAFNVEFKFFTPTANGSITLTLVRPAFMKDEVLGQVIVQTASLANGVPEEKEYELINEPKKKKGPKGTLKLKLHFPLSKSPVVATDALAKPKKIADCFIIGEEIGRGGFSIVKKGVNKDTKENVAIKIIEKKAGEEELMLLHREIDIMRKLQHKHIICLYDVFEDSERIYLILELVTGGELFDQIVSRGVYSERDAAAVISQILEAVAYMHQNGIAHRDLKPENLLCGGQDGRQIKVTDFGLSKDFGKVWNEKEKFDVRMMARVFVCVCGVFGVSFEMFA